MDAAALRAAFPVCAGSPTSTPGPAGRCPRAAAAALAAVAERSLAEGRARRLLRGLQRRSRSAARRPTRTSLGAEAADVSVTTATSEGIARVLLGLDLARRRRGPHRRPTSTPACSARSPRCATALGFRVREVPLADIAGAVSPATRLVACSHVGVDDRRVRARRSRRSATTSRCCSTAPRAPAPSPSTSATLGCAFYAASGQKWLCGPVGTGDAVGRPRLARPAGQRGPHLR